MSITSSSRPVLVAAVAAAVALPLFTASVTPVEAQTRYWRGGQPAYGRMTNVRPYYGNRYYGGYYRHHNNAGPALAAGLIGGLALGALATAPYGYGYGYGYPSYGYPAYRGPVYYEPSCYVTRARVYDRWGNPFWRRVRVCN